MTDLNTLNREIGEVKAHLNDLDPRMTRAVDYATNERKELKDEITNLKNEVVAIRIYMNRFLAIFGAITFLCTVVVPPFLEHVLLNNRNDNSNQLESTNSQ